MQITSMGFYRYLKRWQNYCIPIQPQASLAGLFRMSWSLMPHHLRSKQNVDHVMARSWVGGHPLRVEHGNVGVGDWGGVADDIPTLPIVFAQIIKQPCLVALADHPVILLNDLVQCSGGRFVDACSPSRERNVFFLIFALLPVLEVGIVTPGGVDHVNAGRERGHVVVAVDESRGTAVGGVALNDKAEHPRVSVSGSHTAVNVEQVLLVVVSVKGGGRIDEVYKGVRPVTAESCSNLIRKSTHTRSANTFCGKAV